MPKITINGTELDVDDGLNVIQAAAVAGIEIPHFCYHPSLSVVAQCRQCLVEVEGVPKVLPACNTTVRDGLVVKTDTEKALEARKAAVEFTLINHPLDCPICDKGGECPLQMTTFAHGPGYSRVGGPENKKVRQKSYLSDRIMYDPNRCIMCTRCVRFTDEVTRTHELGTTGRGFRKKISVFPGKKLDNELAGNVIDICPVGALLTKNTLHEERVWYMEFTDSVCSLCSTGCNITVGVDPRKGKVSRIRPRINQEVNGHWICDKGRYDYKEIQESSRLRDPIIKNHKDYEIASWEDAVNNVGSKLSRTISSAAGPYAIAASATLTNEEMFLASKLSSLLGDCPVICGAGAEKTEKKFGLVSSDPYPNSTGSRNLMTHGNGYGTKTIIDLLLADKIKTLIVIETDLFKVVSDHEKQLLSNALEKISFLVIIDYTLTETARYAHAILPSASPYEKDGTFTNDAGRVQKIKKAIAPPGTAKPGWEVLCMIGEKIDKSLFSYNCASEVMDDISLKFPRYGEMSYDKIGAVGKVIENGMAK
ncbi:MAG: molybdopterin-dependent oxidoreductase [Candidatus Dadabacteria bacterium]|nr:molybdopterin-dependent oxidoreductase [Candidatus Dadabacteria bacterium]